MENSNQIWSPAEYDTSKPPRLCTTFSTVPETETATLRRNFPRSAKWCPDGSLILAAYEDHTFQFFDPSQITRYVADLNAKITTVQCTSTPIRQFTQAAPILDFLWYPSATPLDPASFCFMASVRECPVKLLDASDGRLRASYRIVDHRERQIAPHSLAFNLTAQKLYCGFEDAIEVFDLSRPGEGTRIHTSPSKKSKDGLKGIISSLAFCPSYSPEECFYAAGSFSPTENNIALFSDVSSEPAMFVGGGPQAGVTQLQFNPMQPNILYATYRGKGSGLVYSWDIRSNVHAPMKIFQASTSSPYVRESRTNQRIRFDIDPAGRKLSIGDQTGNISVFDLSDGSSTDYLPDSPSQSITFDGPCLTFKAHEDTIGSVAFHPFQSKLVSVSGSRHFTDDYSGSSDEDEDDDSGRHAQHKRQSKPVFFDSTIKTWDFT